MRRLILIFVIIASGISNKTCAQDFKDDIVLTGEYQFMTYTKKYQEVLNVFVDLRANGEFIFSYQDPNIMDPVIDVLALGTYEYSKDSIFLKDSKFGYRITFFREANNIIQTTNFFQVLVDGCSVCPELNDLEMNRFNSYKGGRFIKISNDLRKNFSGYNLVNENGQTVVKLIDTVDHWYNEVIHLLPGVYKHTVFLPNGFSDSAINLTLKENGEFSYKHSYFGVLAKGIWKYKFGQIQLFDTRLKVHYKLNLLSENIITVESLPILIGTNECGCYFEKERK